VLATENEKSLTDTIAAFPPPGRTVLVVKLLLLASWHGYGFIFDCGADNGRSLECNTKALVIALVTHNFTDDLRCK